jgi:2-succinyl-5-enolpyruvyl-6-hydroxy-3-cyclohexene-1-carboxylate synthase
LDWKKAKAEYIRGETSYRKLAEKYGVSFSAVRHRAEKEKWTDLRTQAEQKLSTKIVEKVASQEAKRVDAFQHLADRLLQHITDNIDLLASNATSVKDITVAIKNLREIKGVKSEIDLKEQEARIAKLMKEAMADEKRDNEIKVIMEGDLEKYSN